ncbi:hypothetical protein F0726_02449 [Acidithiobacillus caldus]|jgi:hypothetical protein|nr:hypothetical protein F0726_02449 [Acidithiobacillus caldus]
MTPPAMQKPVRAQEKALSVDSLLRFSPALRRDLMTAIDRAFREHPRTVHPVITWRGHRVRGRLTVFRMLAEVKDGAKWVPICERWHD